ncbi:MAG: hypothetical protein HZB68_01055 [Candidatus Aenigmarchaeota archaeon]|nr:hypothetical protein [Candidatus Aenigmarchaeota archaeon]
MTYLTGQWKLEKTLSDGTYVFRAFGSDMAGNWNVTGTSYVTIDTIRNRTDFFAQLNQTSQARLVQSGNQVNPGNVSLALNYTLDFLFTGATIKIANFSWLGANQSAFPNVSIPAPVNSAFNVSGGAMAKSVWVDVNGFVSSFDPVVEFDYPYRIFFYLNGSSALPQAFRITNECNGVFGNRPCYALGENRSSVYLNSFSGAAAGNDTQRPEITLVSPAGTTSSSVSIIYSVSDNAGVSKCFYSLNGASNVTLTACANTTVTGAQGQNTITIYANDTSGNENSAFSAFTVTVQQAPQASSGGASGGLAAPAPKPEQKKNETAKNSTRETKLCAQVVTSASKDGVCKEFPTPCDVPNGWEKTSSCAKTIEMKEETPTGHITGGFGIVNIIAFAFIAMAVFIGIRKLL